MRLRIIVNPVINQYSLVPVVIYSDFTLFYRTIEAPRFELKLSITQAIPTRIKLDYPLHIKFLESLT